MEEKVNEYDVLSERTQSFLVTFEENARILRARIAESLGVPQNLLRTARANARAEFERRVFGEKETVKEPVNWIRDGF